MTTKPTAILLISIVSVGAGVVSAWTLPADSKASPQARTREKPVDRTTARLQGMSPAQREHARLHVSQGKSRFGDTRPLDEKLSKHVHTDYGPATSIKPVREVVAEMACRVDAAFVGHVVENESLPTEDGRMIFTDHSVLVGDVFRAPSGLALGPTPVTVTRLGGEIEVDGTTVFVKLDKYPPLEVGATYLFFVEFLPRYKTFYAKDPDAVWKIHAGGVWPLSSVRASDRDVMAQGLDGSDVTTWLRGVSCR